MCLPRPKTPRAEIVPVEVICCSSSKLDGSIKNRDGSFKKYDTDVDCHADRGADVATARYQIANPRRHVSLRVLLRLTAMDVCCGPPPTRVLTFLIA
jgi:hypothetical protein